MKATEQLRKEHEAVGLALRILSKFKKQFNEGAEVSSTDLEGMAEFLEIFVDRCHFGKEEDLLIPKLSTISGIDSQFLEMLLNEHVTGRGYILEIKTAVQNLRSDDEAAVKLIAGISSLIDFLKDHAAKEDKDLFAWTDTYLTEAEQDALYEDFEILEVERTGPGKHEELHEYLHEMKKKYL